MSVKLSKILITLSVMLLLSSCSTTTEVRHGNTLDAKAGDTIKKSFLSGVNHTVDASDVAHSSSNKKTSQSNELIKIPSMKRDELSFKSAQMAAKFPVDKTVTVSANKMTVTDFIHYVFGELLGVDYVLTPGIEKIDNPVTLSLKQAISQRQLFNLALSILNDRGLTLKFNDNVYAVTPQNSQGKASTIVGLGRDASSVPTGNNKILQIVPILYGVKVSLKTTIEQLADVSITIDARQGTLFIMGDYNNVIRALELVKLLDAPANRGRYIGLVKLVYSSVDDYLQQLSSLLTSEGIANSINDPSNKNLVFVPLPQIGAVTVFAATKTLYDRVQFWTKTIDKPSEGDVKQYYVFHPRYARASDIGDSLTPLLNASGGNASAALKTNSAANANDKKGQSTGQLTKTTRQQGVSNGKMTLVVDNRSNALIFYSTGTDYKNIIPLINKLDVLPKQVMIDVVVAEVTLTDNFKYGVEWALKNGNLSTGTLGQFGLDAVSGKGGISGFSFLLNNGIGDQIKAKLSQNNDHVNVLSNPNLLVRDGVTASIDIGTTLSLVGSTTINPLNTQTSTTNTIQRKTGIQISVTPTVNAQGVVIMKITESISNALADSVGASGNPNIFERNLDTEVVAESGQTIILGGLIDHKTTNNKAKVPGFGDIPLIGHLFRSTVKESTKTELVLLMTPRVINNTEQWKGIMSSFQNKLENVKID